MTKEELNKILESDEIIITTKSIIKEAVKGHISGLLEWDDYYDFSKGAHTISNETEEEIANYILEEIVGE